MTPRSEICSTIVTFALLCLAACGSGESGFAPSAMYTIGGTLSGLAAGQHVVLTDNGADSLTLSADGAFTFAAGVAAGGTYSVSVATQPAGQTCAVANAMGSNVSADVTAILVSCAAPSQYAYVANSGDNTVSQYTISVAGELTPMSTPTVQTGAAPQSVAVDPAGRYAYVPNLNDNTVSQYTIGTGGSLLPMTPATVQTGAGPWAVSIDPSGSYAYVINNIDRSVSQYTIGAGGTLAPMTPATVATGTEPRGITIDPSGRYAYVSNHLDNTVSQYAVGTGGALKQVSPPTLASGALPSGIAISIPPVCMPTWPIRTTTLFRSTPSVLRVLLAPQNPATEGGAGTGPVYIVVNPNGQNAYVANYSLGGAGTVSQYAIAAGGLLAPMAIPTVATGKGLGMDRRRPRGAVCLRDKH